MTLDTNTYKPTKSTVTAVLLTEGNLEQAARWSGGRVGMVQGNRWVELPSFDSGPIQVPVGAYIAQEHDSGSFFGMHTEEFEKQYELYGRRQDGIQKQARPRIGDSVRQIEDAKLLSVSLTAEDVPGGGRIHQDYDEIIAQQVGRRPGSIVIDGIEGHKQEPEEEAVRRRRSVHPKLFGH